MTIGRLYARQPPAATNRRALDYVTDAFDRIEDAIDAVLVLTRGRKAVGEPTYRPCLSRRRAE